jgi:transcriptional regulator with XRE-family HTH domain
MPNITSDKRRNATLIAMGQTIRRVRKEQGISQEQLALLAEIDRSYVGRVERGDNNIAILTLQKIAMALGLSMGELLIEAQL